MREFGQFGFCRFVMLCAIFNWLHKRHSFSPFPTRTNLVSGIASSKKLYSIRCSRILCVHLKIFDCKMINYMLAFFQHNRLSELEVAEIHQLGWKNRLKFFFKLPAFSSLWLLTFFFAERSFIPCVNILSAIII